MKKQKGIYFAPQWIDYLNDDPELQKRISKGGETPSLEGRDIIALELKGLSNPGVVCLKNGRFSFEERKPKNPASTVKMPLDAFLQLAHPEARVIWSLIDDGARFIVPKSITWAELVTIFEMLVCIQELIDNKPELTAAQCARLSGKASGQVLQVSGSADNTDKGI